VKCVILVSESIRMFGPVIYIYLVLFHDFLPFFVRENSIVESLLVHPTVLPC